jgi:hypothetical protein
MQSWQLRRGFWNRLATFKFHHNKPAVVPIPTVDPRPVLPVPLAAKFPDIPVTGVVVADHVPPDERDPIKYWFSRFQTAMYSVVPPMQPGLPSIPLDPAVALKGAYTRRHRRCYPAPRRPLEYSDGADLGELATASPYACYLHAAGDGHFRWDLSILADFECHRGVVPPWAVVDFVADTVHGRLHAVRINSELGTSTPDSGGWRQAVGIALCAATTHLSLVRHFNWVHLVAGSRLAMTSRNRLPADHPIRRLLWPHVYGTQYSNEIVTLCQMSPGGDFDSIFSFTHSGMCQLFDATFEQFNLRMIHPMVDATDRGVADRGFPTPALDNRLEVLQVLEAHVARYLARYFCDDDALAGDEPFRRWADELARTVPGVATLLGGQVTVDAAVQLLATLIYLVTVEHEIVGSGLWNYQLWSEVHPVRLYRDGSRPPVDVYQRLVNADFNLNVPRTALMSDFSNLALDASGAEAFTQFLADLNALQTKIDSQPPACWRIEPKMLKANINA